MGTPPIYVILLPPKPGFPKGESGFFYANFFLFTLILLCCCLQMFDMPIVMDKGKDCEVSF